MLNPIWQTVTEAGVRGPLDAIERMLVEETDIFKRCGYAAISDIVPRDASEYLVMLFGHPFLSRNTRRAAVDLWTKVEAFRQAVQATRPAKPKRSPGTP